MPGRDCAHRCGGSLALPPLCSHRQGFVLAAPKPAQSTAGRTETILLTVSGLFFSFFKKFSYVWIYFPSMLRATAPQKTIKYIFFGQVHFIICASLSLAGPWKMSQWLSDAFSRWNTQLGMVQTQTICQAELRSGRSSLRAKDNREFIGRMLHSCSEGGQGKEAGTCCTYHERMCCSPPHPRHLSAPRASFSVENSPANLAGSAR